MAKTETAKTRPGRIGRAQMDLFGEGAASVREAARPAATRPLTPAPSGGPRVFASRPKPAAASPATVPPTAVLEPEPAAPPPAPRLPRATAESLAQKQREISISEFFAKNRHLLGFDSPSKALLTTIKEAVDNSLDACEEAASCLS